jgi:hypothetical protein
MLATAPLPVLAPLTAFLILLELTCGTIAVSHVIDVAARVGRGFVGSTALICAGVMGIAMLIGANVPPDTALLNGRFDGAAQEGVVHWCAGFAGALLVFAFFCAVGTNAARRVVGWLTLLVGALSIVAAVRALAGPLGSAAAVAACLVPAALVSGSALAGMLLGHWYLVAPSLSFRPLRIAVNAILVALIAQAVTLAVVLAQSVPATRSRLLIGDYALAFWLLVIGAGILFSAGIALLARHFARMRANQPATAMLYALIVSVLMGDVPAHLLFIASGTPV